MSNVRKPVLMLILALIAALAAESAVLAAAVGRNGKTVTAVRTVASDVPWQISQQADFVDVPGMKAFVSVPAGEKALLVVTFSADTDCGSSGNVSVSCAVRVTLDGVEISPGRVLWANNGLGNQIMTEAGVRSMQWVAGPASQGDHQVKVQARIVGTGFFATGPMTLTVLRSRM